MYRHEGNCFIPKGESPVDAALLGIGGKFYDIDTGAYHGPIDNIGRG